MNAKWLVVLLVPIAVALLVEVSAVASAPSSFQVDLPLVQNWIPTATPTPTVTPIPISATLTWTERAGFPYWYRPVIGGAVIDGQLFAFAINSSYPVYDKAIHALTYDPLKDTWTARPGKSPTDYCCPEMVVASQTTGNIYILIGYYSGSGPATLEYNPMLDTWTARSTMPAPNNYISFGWVAGSNGKLYAMGGYDGWPQVSSAVRIFDPTHDSWSDGAPMPIGIPSPSLAATTDGNIYAFGDGVAEVYNTATNTWSTFTPAASVASQGGAVQAGNGKIYLAGGPQLATNLGFPLKTVLVYDPKTDSWTQQTDLPVGEISPSLVALNGNDLYIVGGFNGVTTESRVWEAKIP